MSLSLAFAFGLLGNIISFFVFLSPLPTFYQIYKKKTTDGFQSIPYIVALFSAMLLMYYAFLKTEGGTLLITINSFGCLIESFYIGVFFYYASKTIKVQTVKYLSVMIGFFGLILGVTHFFVAAPPLRLRIVGWICLIFSVSVFAAPLCILKQVIKTKSVEFMPFSLSFSLTLNAVSWFFYGLLIKDFNIAIPNVIGFIFGIFQMGLYMKYRKPQKLAFDVEKAEKIVETKDIALEKKPEGKFPGPDVSPVPEQAIAVDPQMTEVAKLCAMIEVPQAVVVPPAAVAPLLPPSPRQGNIGETVVVNHNREVAVTV